MMMMMMIMMTMIMLTTTTSSAPSPNDDYHDDDHDDDVNHASIGIQSIPRMSHSLTCRRRWRIQFNNLASIVINM